MSEQATIEATEANGKGSSFSRDQAPQVQSLAPTPAPPRTRAERIAERQARIAARNEARERRNEQKAARRQSRAEKNLQKQEQSHDAEPWRRLFSENADPLTVFDRNEQPISLRGMWAGASGFLVCGGPSVNSIHDLHACLRSRGVVSLAVNNSAGYLPVRAMTFSDPPEKFHHGVFFDPAMMKFVPRPKLKRGQVRIKFPDGSFKFSGLNVRDCPNVWGYERSQHFIPEEFLNSPAATWGNNNEGVKRTGGPKLLFTMFLGLRLLHYLGCKRVFLLGADFRMTGEKGGGYSFSQGRTPAAALSNNNSYRVANEFFGELKPILDDAGFFVGNVNPQSALEAFPFVAWDDAARLAKGFVPGESFSLDGWYTFKNEGREESD